MTNLKRKLVQVVEIDIPRCTLTYGSAPCAAVLGTTGVRKCYNTAATCQDTANYSAAVETIRFAMNVDGLPYDQQIYPAMAKAVDTSPAETNLGGVSERSGPLGKRARVKISLQDFQDSDVWFDRYQAGRIDGTAQTDEGGYYPGDRGEYLSKLIQRVRYFEGLNCRVLEGNEGELLSAMRSRAYVITEIKGPDAGGMVDITVSDALDLANDKKAQAPKPSTGKLGSDIADSGLPSFDLEPVGVGSEYDASGKASIGSEIVSFTRSGDTITLTDRATDGTDAASHSIDDLFQQCYVVTDQNVDAIAYDLLTNYANVPASFIDYADWQAEIGRWMAGYNLNVVIPKPTGVSKLIGELGDLGVFVWWDDTNQEIKMRANRPLDLGETAFSVTDDAVILEKSIKFEYLDKERISRVMFWTGTLDATGSTSDAANFRSASVAIDAVAEGDLGYGNIRLRDVFNRWLANADFGITDVLATRLLNRYRNTPKQVTFDYDAKDAASFDVADPITVTTRTIQDETGNSLPTQMQVTSIQEVIPNHVLRAKAQSYVFDKRYGFIADNARPDYTGSTDEEREKGTYMVGGSGFFPDGTGPYLMF